MSITHPSHDARSRGVSKLPTLRVSRRTGFWAIALSFFIATAFSTAPSSLDGRYEQREHLSSLAVTCAYAVYAIGILASLVLAGHVSDWYGRLTVMLPAIAFAIVAAVLLLTWMSLAGLLVAGVLTGVAIGTIAATAAAFIDVRTWSILCDRDRVRTNARQRRRAAIHRFPARWQTSDPEGPIGPVKPLRCQQNNAISRSF